MEPKSTTSSNSTARRGRLRVLRAEREADLVREMREIGVDPAGIALMAPKGRCRAVRLAGLTPWQANLLKQEMLSLGGEAAVHRGAIDCSAETTDALLLGTEKHFLALLAKLESQPPTMREIGREVREGLQEYDRRRFTLRLGSRRMQVGERTLIMGIVNASPDSFYDGGKHFSADAAVEHGLRLAEEGADILDVGGESSRPGAEPVALEEERRRVLPVVERLSAACDVPLSVDTCKAAVAAEAVGAGAVMVNDISGLRFDARMAEVVAAAGAAVVIMHMQGEPRTMQADPSYDNVMAEILLELGRGVERALEAGVDREQILVDPGIGFGKKLAHNLHIFRHLSEMRVLGRPVVVGPSRKAFIGALSNLPPAERLEGTLAAACHCAGSGADVIRVHDVAAVRRAVQITDAICRGAQ